MIAPQRVALLMVALGVACAGEDVGEDEFCVSGKLPDRVTLGSVTMRPGDLYSCGIRHAVIQYPTADGLRVAADGAGATLVSNHSSSARLFRTGPQGFEIEALPQEFANSEILLSQDGAGKLAYVVGERGPSPKVGPHYFVRDGAGWAAEHAIADPMRLEDFELDAAGNPTIWSVRVANNQLQRVTRAGSGGWVAKSVANAGRRDRYNLALDDGELHYYYAAAGSHHDQLVVEDDGEVLVLSPPTPDLDYYLPVPPPRPATAGSGPQALVVQQSSAGLRLLGSDGSVVDIPGTSRSVTECSEPSSKCAENPCHVTGGGPLAERVGVTRAPDGSVWIGWEIEIEDHWVEYGQLCDEPGGQGCYCWKTGIFDDNDRHEFHLARVVGGEVDEVLTIPTSAIAGAQALRDIDLRAYGDRLAVGLRTHSGANVVLHLLDIDLSRLPAGRPD